MPGTIAATGGNISITPITHASFQIEHNNHLRTHAPTFLRTPFRRRLNVDDGVRYLRESIHQHVFHLVRQCVGVGQRHRPVEPDVKIEKDVIGCAARADMVTAEHLRHAFDDLSNMRRCSSIWMEV